VKRDKADMDADLEKIREYWFGPPLRYQYGASVVLNEKGSSIKVIRNGQITTGIYVRGFLTLLFSGYLLF